ncbi:MAG TPA: four helix bundle protein [Parafilimonas sp.]|nr:four helix bundle protein [Parafilimonas sp.]
MASERKFDLEDRIIDFSSRVIDVVEALPNSRAGNYIAAQLIRCGLAPSLMYGEAQAAESRDDFIHKMKLLAKEFKETRVCMKLISKKAMIRPEAKIESLRNENDELIAIVCKSIETAKRNNRKAVKN